MDTNWLNQSQWHTYFSQLVPRTTLEKALYRAYVTHTATTTIYKCRHGTACNNYSCTHLHPYEAGYNEACYYEQSIPCPYETETTACRLKCGSKSGKYCSYTHCPHLTRETVRCFLPDCQKHCPRCI